MSAARGTGPGEPARSDRPGGPAPSDRPKGSARARILERLSASLERREAVEHPGRFDARRSPQPDPLDAFAEAFQAAGGTCVRVAGLAEASAWLSEHSKAHGSVALGEGVPAELRPAPPGAPPETARLAVSSARGAAAETGTLLLDARDGRRAQLLTPTHVVLVRADTVHPTLVDALEAIRDDLPSAVGLHSGPSKSADIGQVMVRGVHGPGDVVALVIG